MGARISQRPIDQARTWSIGVDVQRDGVSVFGPDPVLRSLPFYQGVGLLAWNFAIPAILSGPGGPWVFFSEDLTDFTTQVIGQVFTPTGTYQATLSNGAIVSSAVIDAGDQISIRGMVVV